MAKNTLTINKADGSFTIKNFPLTIKKYTSKAEIASYLTPLYRSNIDYKNGTEWQFFEGIEFSECPCKLGFFFEDGLLEKVKIDLTPVHIDRSKAGWASDQSVNEAVLLTLIEMRIQLGRPFKNGKEEFDWGEVWAFPDLKRSEMDAGIRYKTLR